MVTVIKKGSDKKAIEALSNAKNYKGFDALKYCGALKIDEDALLIQKRMRDEWP